jgi:hypothetical protein
MTLNRLWSALERLLGRQGTASLAEVGVRADGDQRSGTYVLRDQLSPCAMAWTDGLEILPIASALEQYGWLRDRFYWHAVPADLDGVTQQAASQLEPHGYLIHVARGARVALPCQAALYMAATDEQLVYNIVILEEDAELALITGCMSEHGLNQGRHLAVSEQYIGQNATLIHTMAHSWGPEVVVRPRSGTIVEQGGTLVSNYVSLRPAADIVSHPKTWLNGRGASAKYNTVILGSAGAVIDTGGEVFLNGEDTRAELVHRGVSTGGQILQRGLLVGNARCRAHVDCAGMLLNAGPGAQILSIPGLRALHPEAQMSHEASIGRIAPEQVAYLQSRGLEEREAISMIVRGFLDIGIEGLGPELDLRIAEIAELAGHGET